jgi:hypothetical protein
MIPAMFASSLLVVLCILIHYEVLRLTSDHLAELPVSPRARILVVVIACFAKRRRAQLRSSPGSYILRIGRSDRFRHDPAARASATAGECP